MARQVKNVDGSRSHNVSLFGQDRSRDAWTIAKLNFLFHDLESSHVEVGDALRHPLQDNNHLMLFDRVVGVLPMHGSGMTQAEARHDRYRRFARGFPSKGRDEFGYVLHVVEALASQGCAGVVVPQGVLFRGGREGVIRRSLVEENLVDCVIALPQHLIYGAGVPAAVVIFNKARKRKTVMFIDASTMNLGTKHNLPEDEDVEQIVSWYRGWKSVANHAYVSSQAQIRNNQFNLSVSRYVRSQGGEGLPFEVTGEDDLPQLESELRQVRNDIRILLQALSIDDPDDTLTIAKEQALVYWPTKRSITAEQCLHDVLVSMRADRHEAAVLCSDRVEGVRNSSIETSLRRLGMRYPVPHVSRAGSSITRAQSRIRCTGKQTRNGTNDKATSLRKAQ